MGNVVDSPGIQCETEINYLRIDRKYLESIIMSLYVFTAYLL